MKTLHFEYSLQLFQFGFLLLDFRVVMSVDFAEQKPRNVEHFLQLLRMLQLQVTQLVAAVLLKQVKKPTHKHLAQTVHMWQHQVDCTGWVKKESC